MRCFRFVGVLFLLVVTMMLSRTTPAGARSGDPQCADVCSECGSECSTMCYENEDLTMCGYTQYGCPGYCGPPEGCQPNWHVEEADPFGGRDENFAEYCNYIVAWHVTWDDGCGRQFQNCVETVEGTAPPYYCCVYYYCNYEGC
jgi:hypothetical protein